MADNVPTTAAGNQQGSGGGRPPSFTVEFGDEQNRTITINSLKARVRGRFSLTGEGQRRDVGGAMLNMPTIPGMRMTVDLRLSAYRLFDPLEETPDLVNRINSVLSEARAAIKGGKHTFVPATTGKLDPDQLKSLVIDLSRLVNEGSARVIDGRLPTPTQIASMEGDELYDPWNSSAKKPKYAKDADKHYAAMEKSLAE